MPKYLERVADKSSGCESWTAVKEDEGAWGDSHHPGTHGREGKRGCRRAQVEGLVVCTRTRQDFHYLLFGHAVFAGWLAQEQHAASHRRLTLAVNAVSHPAGVGLIVTDWCQHSAEGKQKTFLYIYLYSSSAQSVLGFH